jgi:hypothetical protein
MDWVVGVILDNFKNTYLIHMFRIHTSHHQHWEWLKEDLVFDLPEIYKTNLNLTDQRSKLQFKQHWKLQVLSSSLLLDVYLVLVNTFICSPVDALVRGDWVFGGCALQNHVFAQLYNRQSVKRLF